MYKNKNCKKDALIKALLKNLCLVKCIFSRIRVIDLKLKSLIKFISQNFHKKTGYSSATKMIEVNKFVENLKETDRKLKL
jgi:hypothetical protein